MVCVVQHELPVSKADLVWATSEDLTWQQLRPTLALQYGTISWMQQPVTWWPSDYSGAGWDVVLTETLWLSTHVLSWCMMFLMQHPAGIAQVPDL